MIPHSIKARIEIPAMGRVKYEIDKETGHLMVDRFLQTPMYYPCNYGLIEQTLAGDGDELDILVITPEPLAPKSYIYSRPIGVLHMTDEKGEDAKIIALPLDEYLSVNSIADFEKIHPKLLQQLKYFFEHYKDLDEGKWAKVSPDFGDKQAAEQLIQEAVAAYHSAAV